MSQILLVGGGTRVPKVQEILLKESGKYVYCYQSRLKNVGSLKTIHEHQNIKNSLSFLNNSDSSKIFVMGYCDF